MLTGILLANGNLNASILNSLYNENLVKEGNYRNLASDAASSTEATPSLIVVHMLFEVPVDPSKLLTTGSDGLSPTEMTTFQAFSNWPTFMVILQCLMVM